MRTALPLTVAGSTGSDSWSTTDVVVDTFVAPLAGSTLRTVGWGAQAARPRPTNATSTSARIREENKNFTDTALQQVARRGHPNGRRCYRACSGPAKCGDHDDFRHGWW